MNMRILIRSVNSYVHSAYNVAGTLFRVLEMTATMFARGNHITALGGAIDSPDALEEIVGGGSQCAELIYAHITNCCFWRRLSEE